MSFYRIAGITVEMEPTGRTARQAEAYRIDFDGKADMVICCDPQKTLAMNPQLETLDAAEYIATGTIFARKMLDFGGFQLHSCAVGLDGKAYLFSAPSGVGKSTHGARWCRMFGAIPINDDKPLLRHTEDGWMVYGTPWSGKHDLSTPGAIPLGGIAFLFRGQENTIWPMEPSMAVTAAISQCLRYLTHEQMEKQLTLVDQLLKDVHVWHLTCRNDDASAEVSREAMKK